MFRCFKSFGIDPANFRGVVPSSTMNMLCICMLILLVPYDIRSIEASRGRKILPPPMPIETPPAPRSMSKHMINRYKKYETRAYRPTCPGPSPGVGHGNPPGSC